MLAEYLDPEKIIIVSQIDNYDLLLRKLLEKSTEKGIDDLITRIKQRDELMPTALGKGIALPRVLAPNRESTEILIAVLERGLSLGGFDVIPVRLIFLFICSKKDDYPSLIAQSIRLCSDDTFRTNAFKCKKAAELIDLIQDWELK